MRLVTPEIEIDKTDPFKNDKLSRKPFAKSLLNLISNVDDTLVISLDSPWGDGKTTFVKMWHTYLENEGIKSLYFDAFANDSFEDPFTALVGSINLLIEKEFSKNKNTEKKLKEFKEKAVKVGTRLLAWGTKVGVKAVTLNVVKDTDIEELKDIAGDIASDTSNAVSKYIEDKLDFYSEAVNATEQFKKSLEELAEDAYKQNGKPLVFIIDELDRCKPTYALELIEKIKHLFSVKHVVFVLVMHAEQLCESVKCVYGQKIDARTYLHKFINIECKLPKCVKINHTSPIPDIDYGQYCESLSELHQLPIKGRWEGMWIPARVFEISLRDLQRCFTYLTLSLASFKENTFNGDLQLLSLLIILKVKRPDIYESVKLRNITLDDLWTKLELGKTSTRDEKRWEERLKNIFEICLLPNRDFSQLDQNTKTVKLWNHYEWEYGFTDRDDLLEYHLKPLESFSFPENEE